MVYSVKSPRLPSYLPEFDGLRAVAVLLVLWVHLPYIAGSTISKVFWLIGQETRAGYIGVDLFFVLSGFLITRILLNEQDRSGSIDFIGFYIRRSLRIFPIYYICVAVYCLVFSDSFIRLISLSTYTFNYYHPLHPAPDAMEHTWSLDVEEQFYLLWPLLMASLPRRWMRAVTGLVIPAVSIFAALLLAMMLDKTLAASLIYMSGPTRMLSLSLGSALAYREQTGDGFKGWTSYGRIAAGVAMLLGDDLARTLGFMPAGGYYWCVALLSYALASSGIVALLVWSKDALVRAARAVLGLQPLRYIGRISYGLYLYHYLVLNFLGLEPSKVAATGTTTARLFLALVLSIGMAAVSYELLESRILRIKDRLAAGGRPLLGNRNRVDVSAG